MCSSPDAPAPPPPPPKAPPVLEQIAPKSAKDSDSSKIKKKAKGLSRYKMDSSNSGSSKGGSLGGIPKKTGTGN